jgi:hypothetical protein
MLFLGFISAISRRCLRNGTPLDCSIGLFDFAQKNPTNSIRSYYRLHLCAVEKRPSRLPRDNCYVGGRKM